ncbi:MAG: TonB-dependent receptor plug domain-containing protein [Wenzhouxiangellaceae bacterium]
MTLPAAAQQESEPDEVDRPEDAVVSIGTRVQGRTATETTVAIDVIGQEDLSRPTGLFETGEMLQRLAPSFNFSRTAISDGSDIFRPATLRGLGPDQVLVLINGKRRHNRALLGLSGTVGQGSAGVDFNAIPSMALKQVEILRDGAAAQYGSDAIAGVVNLQLRDSVDEFTISSMVGQTFDSDGERFQVQANGGFAIGNGGFVNLTGEYRVGDPTNRAAESPQFPGEKVFQHGDADTDFFGFFGNSALPLSETVELYAFGGYSESEATGAGFFRFVDQADRSVPQVFPEGFLPRDTNKATDSSIALGVRGGLAGDWAFDLSGVYGKNEYEFGAENTVNASIAADFFNRNPGATDAEVAANSGPREGFSGGQDFEQLTFNLDFSGPVDVGLNNPLFVAFGAEYRDETFKLTPGQFESFACGLDDDAAVPSIVDPNVIATCGFQAFPGFRPENAVDASRDSFALYVDLESNLTPRLLVGLAGRYEDFGSIGDELTGKLSGRYQIVDDLAFRGAVQTGFRAPSLQQLSVQNITTTAGPDGLTEILQARTGSEFPSLLGIEGLEIETSESFSAGFVWEPASALTITLDGYLINIDDRISLGAPVRAQDLEAFPEALQFLEDSLVGQVSFFSNAIDTRTRGVDVVINHSSNLVGGSLRSTLAFSYNKTTIRKINAPEGIDEDLIFNQSARDFIVRGQPRERVNLSFDWNRGPFNSLLRFNYLGKTRTSSFTKAGLGLPGFLPVNDDPFLSPGSALLVDLEFSYRVTRNVQLAVGANNLLDEKPDKLAEDSAIGFISRGNIQFPMRGLAYGLNGGFYYAQVRLNF